MSQTDNQQNPFYKAIQNLNGSDQDKNNWMIKNMDQNMAFLYKSKKLSKNEKSLLLKEMKSQYLNYRKSWRMQPGNCFSNKIFGKNLKKKKIIPLCIDIELASVCDLACPHCFRQFVPTPDKIMNKNLALKVIDQSSQLGVPSMKFNWRGEPLMNPNTPEIINYAKKKGILETIMNTNATMLDEKMAKKIIFSGLDSMIYSFDGGTKKSYEKMRPGRFNENNFDSVIKNIKNFSKLKNEMNVKFPRTKIQMVLTKDTRKEQEEFFSLFKDFVDDISVKQYSERGGQLKDIDDEVKEKIRNKTNSYKPSSEVMMDHKANLFVSEKRLPCEQPFQRLLVGYDGRVSMCCYDWGSQHPVGIVDDRAIKLKNKDFDDIIEKSKKNKKGFELMNLKENKSYNKLDNKVSSINEIWNGKDINKVRELHVNEKIEKVKVCKNCTFKDTYKWVQLN